MLFILLLLGYISHHCTSALVVMVDGNNPNLLSCQKIYVHILYC